MDFWDTNTMLETEPPEDYKPATQEEIEARMRKAETEDLFGMNTYRKAG